MRTDSTRTTRRAVLLGVGGVLTAAGLAGAQQTTTEGGETTTDGEQTTPGGEATTFQVRIVNVSDPDALTPDGAESGPVILSPGAYAVHSPSVQLFTTDEPASDGLESVAEDGDPSGLAAAIDGVEGISASGTFAEPVAGGGPQPIGPGAAYGFRVEARPGDVLSFATMFVPSNDLFYAPGPEGIALFSDGDPVSGDVTDRVALWDAGTERNEEPGAGPNQAPRQSGPDTGPAEDAPVRDIGQVDDGYEYPAVSDAIQVLVVPEGGDVGDGMLGTATETEMATETETATATETTTE